MNREDDNQHQKEEHKKEDSEINFGPNFMSDDIPIFQAEESSENDWKDKLDDESKKVDEKYNQRQAEKKSNTTNPAFMRLVSLVGSQAYIFLGAIENPSTGSRTVNLEQAQDSIESLAALVAKTKSNLSEEEDRMLTQVVSELQMLYVEASRQHSSNQDPGISPSNPAQG